MLRCLGRCMHHGRQNSQDTMLCRMSAAFGARTVTSLGCMDASVKVALARVNLGATVTVTRARANAHREMVRHIAPPARTMGHSESAWVVAITTHFTRRRTPQRERHRCYHHCDHPDYHSVVTSTPRAPATTKRRPPTRQRVRRSREAPANWRPARRSANCTGKYAGRARHGAAQGMGCRT
jgi:hypothetical protein